MPRWRVKLPKYGLTMEEGQITEWLVEIGDTVTQGQPIATIASEKAEIEFESPFAGTLAEYLVEIGEIVEVGHPVAVIVTDDQVDS